MGRGRAKAKQAKIARRLKYTGGDIDLERLRAEISAQRLPDAWDHLGDGRESAPESGPQTAGDPLDPDPGSPSATGISGVSPS